MKKSTLALFICLISLSAFSQLKGSSDRYILELNWNSWRNTPDSIQLKPFSRGFNFYTMFDFPFKEKSKFSFAAGLGLSTENIYHNGQFMVNDSVGTTIIAIPDSQTYKNNKINTVYAEIPLELRFRTKPLFKNNRLKIGVGVKGGMLLASHTKYVGDGTAFGQFGPDVKIKVAKIPNLSKYRYGITGRIGFGPYNFIGYYGLSTLFNEGKGPGMIPVSIGFTFNML